MKRSPSRPATWLTRTYPMTLIVRDFSRPVTAEKIIDYRTAHGAFRSVDELDEVPGIGPARVEQLRGLVVP